MFRPSRPLLVIVGGMDQFYRGPNVHQAADRYRVTLIDSRPPTWQHHLVVDHELADTRDPAAVVAAGLTLAGRHPIEGVLTWDEYALVPASVLASRLALPSSPAAAMHAARNKAQSRQRFTEHGVPSARAIRVDTLAQATNAARHIGFPIVLKPVSHAASIGVIRVNNAHDLPDAWQFTATGADAQGTEGHGVLVEEYLDGPEISVECATIDGATTPLAVTRKQPPRARSPVRPLRERSRAPRR